MKYIITGASGLLGKEILRFSPGSIGISSLDCDLIKTARIIEEIAEKEEICLALLNGFVGRHSRHLRGACGHGCIRHRYEAGTQQHEHRHQQIRIVGDVVGCQRHGNRDDDGVDTEHDVGFVVGQIAQVDVIAQ